MTGTRADPVPRCGSVARAALAAVERFLLDPPEPVQDLVAPEPPTRRPVVAVFGLAPRCGATVAARALAAELALRDPSGAAVVACEDRSSGIPLGTPAAARLARSLASMSAAPPRAAGRLCLLDCADRASLAAAVRGVAPLVLDAGRAAVGGAAAAVADAVILVAGSGVEPSLAAAVAGTVARVGPAPLLVLGRGPADGWGGRAVVVLPDSRMGARLALAGREPRGALGKAIAELADRLGGGG